MEALEQKYLEQIDQALDEIKKLGTDMSKQTDTLLKEIRAFFGWFFAMYGNEESINRKMTPEQAKQFREKLPEQFSNSAYSERVRALARRRSFSVKEEIEFFIDTAAHELKNEGREQARQIFISAITAFSAIAGVELPDIDKMADKHVSSEYLGDTLQGRLSKNKRTLKIETILAAERAAAYAGSAPYIVMNNIKPVIEQFEQSYGQILDTAFMWAISGAMMGATNAKTYTFRAVLDSRTTQICRTLNRMVFPFHGKGSFSYRISGNPKGKSLETRSDRTVKAEYMGASVGVNYPPMHLMCRSYVIPNI